MCGIAGVVGARLSPKDREQAVRRMIARQKHRGPDDHGLVSSGIATIGMCRLAIFDPANGKQPMTTPDGRFQVVFNGAIYNFREVRTQLEPLGWKFRTECDTEVLLAAFAHWGEGCLERLRGMFAFAVWDTVERTLFAARDPFGIKPLYYSSQTDGTFCFASEINGLCASGLVPRDIDPVSVGDYLAWFAVPAPRTIYLGIENLPPGHFVKVDAGGSCEVTKWWRMPPPNREAASSRSYAEFQEQLRSQLENTIRAHRLADVPVGAFLSGGLDSSAIVGLMAASGASQLKTFSLVFNEKEYSEQEPARLAARIFGAEHHEEVLTGAQIARDLPRILETFDQPTGDGINTYYVSRAAHAGGVKVALSGLGGDEIFGGYPSFRDTPRIAAFLPYWRWLPAGARSMVLEQLRIGSARSQKLADFLEHARDLHEVCSLRRRIVSETARIELLAPEARQLSLRQGPNHPMLDDFVFELLGADRIQIVSAWEIRTYMADVLLRDSDVFSMAHSLELRVPFVDPVFVGWWWGQPRRFRYDPRRLKAALADAVTGTVPSEILNRRKQGFGLPYELWMRAELRPFLEHTFSRSSLDACPWLDAQAAQRQWQRFDAGLDPHNWTRVWTLAVLIAFAGRSLRS